MDNKYSLELHAAYHITVVVTNHFNGLLLETPIVIEVDPDHILSTETFSIHEGFKDRQNAFNAAIAIHEQIDAQIVEISNEIPQTAPSLNTELWIPSDVVQWVRPATSGQ